MLFAIAGADQPRYVERTHLPSRFMTHRSRNGLSQRPSSSFQSNVLPTMVGPSKRRPPMSHRKSDLGIPYRSESAKVVLGRVLISAQIGGLLLPERWGNRPAACG